MTQHRESRHAHAHTHTGPRAQDAPTPGHSQSQSQGQGHRHAHHFGDTQPDWSELALLLEREAEIASPAYAEAAAWLGTLVPVQGVRRLLDIGSGPGVVTAVLADAFPAAEAVAVDGSTDLLDRALARAEARGLGARVSTLHAELPEDLPALGEADLLWAGNSLHHIGDQRGALAEFAALLRPGGLVALVEGGLPSRHLPRDIGFGRPGLEARIDALQADRFAQMRAELPGTKEEPENWRELLASAGLTPAGTRTFLTDVPAPMSPVVRELAVTHFGRMRDVLGAGLDADDRATLDRLLDPADEGSLHRRADLHLLTARTVHTARKG